MAANSLEIKCSSRRFLCWAVVEFPWVLWLFRRHGWRAAVPAWKLSGWRVRIGTGGRWERPLSAQALRRMAGG